MRHPPRRRIVLITGMAGAGMSTALKALEDIGYEALDNLPLFLVEPLLGQSDLMDRALAIGIDSRTRGFTAESMVQQYEGLAARDELDARLVFLDCTDEVLQRRYTETRRRHPLAIDRSVADGIALERGALQPLRARADPVIDTSELSIHDLRRILRGQFALGDDPGLQVFVMSFSYRAGLPRDADLVFDVRFLNNPHYEPALRPLTGRDGPIARFIVADEGFHPFFDGLTRLLDPLLPRYRHEGKSYLTIAIGCTGGRHRSVFVAERLRAWLADRAIEAGCTHRDLPPGEAERPPLDRPAPGQPSLAGVPS